MNEERRETMACTHAGTAAPEAGMVILEGPDGIAVTMTPFAAAETARRLLRAAEEASRHSSDRRHW